MSNKINNAWNQLVEELIMATGMPDTPFTIVLTIEPIAGLDSQGEDIGTGYKLVKLVINQEIYTYDDPT